MQIAKKNNYESITELILACAAFFSIITILISPVKYSSATLNGAKVFAVNIVPTLLPFFFLTKILTELGTVKRISQRFSKICNKVFNISGIGAFIFLMGLMCGYPTGAKLTADFLEKDEITAEEAHRITALVSTSGPMFVIATVGAGFMLSAKIGVIVFFAHILGALANGLAFKKYGSASEKKINANIMLAKPNKKTTLSESIADTLWSILIVGVYIILFFLFIEIFLTIFKIKNPVFLSLTAGIIEITRGTLEVSKNITNFKLATMLITFIVSFGGLSVHLQSLAFLGKSKISYRFFLFQKLTHAVFATIFAFIFAFIFL